MATIGTSGTEFCDDLVTTVSVEPSHHSGKLDLNFDVGSCNTGVWVSMTKAECLELARILRESAGIEEATDGTVFIGSKSKKGK